MLKEKTINKRGWSFFIDLATFGLQFMKITELYKIYLRHPKIVIDSRKVSAGDIFFALKGDHFDGNDFAKQALEKGAVKAVIDNKKVLDKNNSTKFIIVDDALKTLQQLATYHRSQLDIPVIGIAGSNGKTTTKELIKTVLEKKYNTFATPGNLNNHIGLPLSILKITKTHEIAVLELGANHPGEHAFLCEICKPNYGIITNIGKDHLEGYGSFEGVINAHKEFTDYLKNAGGFLFLNADDKEIVKLAKGLNNMSFGKKIGLDKDIEGEIVNDWPFLEAKIYKRGNFLVDVESNLYGSFHLYNILASIAIGDKFEIKPEAIKIAVKSYVPANNRSQLINWGNNTIILDAYNANPTSMELSIKDFIKIKTNKQKCIILGDMFELGTFSEIEHEKITKMLDKQGTEVVLIGPEFKKAKLNGMIHFDEVLQAKKWFLEQAEKNKLFFIKGSRGMALERIIQDI